VRLRIFPPNAKAHRLVKKLYVLMKAERMTRERLEKESGVAAHTIKAWWSGKSQPLLGMIEACFQAVGYQLDIRESHEC